MTNKEKPEWWKTCDEKAAGAAVGAADAADAAAAAAADAAAAAAGVGWVADVAEEEVEAAEVHVHSQAYTPRRGPTAPASSPPSHAVIASAADDQAGDDLALEALERDVHLAGNAPSSGPVSPAMGAFVVLASGLDPHLAASAAGSVHVEGRSPSIAAAPSVLAQQQDAHRLRNDL